jgi:drug/metabolite transporter (DMT)-like permease
MTGALFAIIAAAAFGLNTAIVRRGVRWAPPYYLIIFSLTAAVPVFVVMAFMTGQGQRAGELAMSDYLLLSLAGVLNFIGGRYSNFKAIAAIGANLTAPLRTFSTLISAILGFTILNEEITELRLLGLGLIIAAPLLAFSRPAQMKVELRSGTRLKLAEGFTFSGIAALSYAFANFLLGYVLVGTSLSILGAAVAHAAAAAVMLATLALPRNQRGVSALNRNSLYVFLLVSVTMISAQVFRFAAFERAPVSVVSALVETLAFFGLGFAYLINRDHELFTRQVVAGVGLAVVGAVALTI